ncbi:MAG TPA: ATPase [Syntrophomonadaceae bacterium]|nr:ATPase [Syntrophomonadaceae bacterium]
MMEIYRVLDELELIMKESRKIPFSNGKIIIETHTFLDRLDRIRAILPEELETAKLVLTEKDRIVREACDEAEQYVELSKDKVARMVDESEITQQAMKVAEEIVAKAEEVAVEIRRDANEYAEGVLAHMEIVLKRGLEAVSQGRDDIKMALRTGDY